ncbi:helix-turn-helix domain-containing protein [Nocardioides sp. Root140]|uniref:PucR family transcriptional regulator n=1 Tax=Nocardioides sp. Root140 TaxID=1736460 RepID=UPI000AA385B8|nr:helix-turn-helix domain-containing protein [Nocardioides sp. Root140]
MSLPTPSPTQRVGGRLPQARAPRLTIAAPPPSITPEMVAIYRPRAVELTRRIAERISCDVVGFRDPRLRDLITEAIDSAVTLFVDALAGAPVRGASVAAAYRRLGSLEAEAGHDLDAMRAAHQIATQESWDDLRTLARELDLPLVAVDHLMHALFDYQRQLLEHALLGFGAPRRTPDARLRLLTALATGADDADVRALAQRVGWTIPDLVAVAVAGDPSPAAFTAPCGAVLVGTYDGALVLLGAPDDVEQQARVIATSHGPVAISWGVEPDASAHALRWGLQTLKLVADRIIDAPGDGVVWCEAHQAELCLHADPVLRRCADEQVLAPLLAETPKRRAALAETMLVWLQTGHTAPAVARLLKVHEQTVRSRLKHIKHLFGDRLDDPAETVGLLTALESMTPRWLREPDDGRRRTAVLVQSVRRR